MELDLQTQFELPLVKDLIAENEILRHTSVLTGTKIADSQIKNIEIPYVIKNRLLMKAGEFNGIVYPEEEIKSKIEDMNGKPIMLDHKDSSNEGVSAWVGEIQNAHWDSGEQGIGAYADLIILDKPSAQKLAYGAKWGISPTIDYEKNEVQGETIGTDLLWKSFSFVITPAVRDTMLNSKKEENQMVEDKDKKKKYPYKYPAKGQDDEEKKKKKKEEEEKTLEVDEETLEILEAKDVELTELRKFKDGIDTEKKAVLVSELTANEFLIGRLSEDELSEREKYLMEKSIDTLSEISSVIGDHAELSAYTAFIKKYIKAHKGADIKEAAKAWKKEKPKGKLEETPAVEEPDKPDEDKSDEDKPDETQTDSLTGKDNVHREKSELMKKNPRIKSVDVGMYNFLARRTPGGMLIK